ncbi:MAG: HAD-IC family P-type ATPase [Patescibacteria group bacterium]
MRKHWHAISLEDIFDSLNCGCEGLRDEEAAERLKKFGRNVLPQEKPYSRIRLFLRQFNSPLMYILLTTVAISFTLRHYSDTIFICLVLLINTTVGFYQENKANQSILALRQMVKVRARVLRGGNEKEIDSEKLVVGDIVMLKAGDKVPSDGRIIDAKDLKINESNLTGEWLAVDKNRADGLAEKTLLSERSNMVFMGTIVEEGEARFLVVATGVATEIGEIVSLLRATKEKRTPLQKKILSLSKLVGAFVMLVISVIVLVGYFKKEPFADVFVAALALAVSAIPEGLLPAITVILVLGMRRILKQRGLVKKLIANETLGSVTIICTDKTGTLTEGKMQVSHILTNTRELMSENFNGLAKGENANGVESHILALKIAMLANDAFVENPEAEFERWVARGRPTDQALLLAGMQAGLNKKELEKQYFELDKIAFSSELKYAARLNRIAEKKKVFYIVGAPEAIVAKSVWLDVDGRKEKLSEAESEKLNKKIDVLADKGLRVLACAYREYDLDKAYNKLTELAEELILVGFIALKDPLRQDVKESINVAKKAGIRTVIITGDHKLTAKAVAEELGFEVDGEQILEGGEIEKINDKELENRVSDILIYARVSPSHKLRIVRALQAKGEVVAMIGDGVNDAPALKSADIGVAVGSGSDVAKEVADLILLDNNFKTVVKAVEQGRIIFGNIRKVFVYLVADDFSELFLFLGAMALGAPLPLLPAQILWINLVEDGFPSIALTGEQGSKGVMAEKPRSPDEPILNKPLKQWLAVIFFITGLTALIFFLIIWRTTGDLERARTMVFTLMCVDSLLFAFCVRSFKQSIFRRDIFSNHYLVGAVAISFALLLSAVYLPPLQKILGTQGLALGEWGLILAIGLAEILMVEFSKKRIFR